MTVYVDDMFKSPMGRFRRMKMSHMMADSTDELLAMADKIGVARKWLQHPGTPREHFDIALSKRGLAVAEGAVEVSVREMAAFQWARLNMPMMGRTPAAALALMLARSDPRPLVIFDDQKGVGVA